MIGHLKIHALIPARSGSKSIRDKNILMFHGKPLLAHSILQARESQYIDEVYVSTDSQKYADIAVQYGARVPFLRPASISGDHATDFEVFDHFIGFQKSVNQVCADIYVHLRPTYPTRKTERIDEAIRIFVDHMDTADSLRSVIPVPHTPYKMWTIDGDYLKPLLHLEGVDEPYNMPRQKLPEVYLQNACIDILQYRTVAEKRSMTGDRILAYKMAADEVHDIDTMADFHRILKTGE